MDRGNYRRGGGDSSRGPPPPQSFGAVTRNFEIGVDRNMTCVSGRILPAPDLKLGGQNGVPVDNKCQWNLVGKSVMEGKALQRWALIDFSSQERSPNFRLRADEFVYRLKEWCKKLGINMEEPVIKHFTGMYDLSAVSKVEDLLRGVVHAADKKMKGRLQMIVCVMPARHNGYKYLKWVSDNTNWCCNAMLLVISSQQGTGSISCKPLY